MREQMIMFFFISKLSKYSQDFASSWSDNEYEYKPSPQTLSPDMARVAYIHNAYVEGRDPCPDYIMI